MRIHDGAYGTLLQHHLHGDETVDDLSVRAPLLVVAAHDAYLAAGADVIQTNAFLVHLRGSQRRRRELRDASFDAALEAAAAHAGARVAWTIGPAGTEPRDYWEAVEHALEHDSSIVLCETVTSELAARAFLAAWADVAAGVDGTEVLLGCSLDAHDSASSGWVLDVASDAPAAVTIGLNCCSGPVGMGGLLAMIAELRGATWAMPSAGLPAGEPPAWPFADPALWVEEVSHWLDDVPLVGVGGCCGTGPATIGALASIAAAHG